MTEDWDDELVDITFTQKAVSYIENHEKAKKDSPFFLYFTPSAPHRPCVPPAFIRGSSGAGEREDMVKLVDWSVGQILEALERTHQLEHTLVIVTSDNGAHLTNADGRDHGHKPNGDLRGGKGDIHEGGHRVPFVAMWPQAIPGGIISDHTSCLCDLFATLAELTETTLDDETAEDSVSFYAHLTNQKTKDPLVCRPIVHHAMDGMFAVRNGDWKAVFGSGSGGFSEPKRYIPQPNEPIGQLYHLHAALRENLNVWAQYPEIVDSLAEILAEYRTSGRSR
jgi:arylsulfatase A-like enzyme